jgi:hypothetical protein
MRIYLLCALISLLSNSLFAQDWNADWYKPDYLKSFSEKEIIKMISGKFRSKYFIMGRSEPRSIMIYDLEIDQNGKMTVYNNNSVIKKDRVSVLEYELHIANKNGIVTAATVLTKQNNKELISINTNMFTGILYISKDLKEIMFGNNIEADGGPASVWGRITP